MASLRARVTRDGDRLTLRLYVRNDSGRIVSVVTHVGVRPSPELEVWSERRGKRSPLPVDEIEQPLGVADHVTE